MYTKNQILHMTGASKKLIDRLEEKGILSTLRDGSGSPIYSNEHITVVYKAVLLKNLGFTFQEIESQIGDFTIEAILNLASNKRIKIANEIKSFQRNLLMADARISLVDWFENIPTHNSDICLKEIPELETISIREKISTIFDLEDLYFRVVSKMGASNISLEYPIVIYHDKSYKEHNLDVELLFPLPENLGTLIFPLQKRTLPKISVISAIHTGNYLTRSYTFAQIISWSESHNLRLAGPSREVFINGINLTNSNNQVEIQYQLIT